MRSVSLSNTLNNNEDPPFSDGVLPAQDEHGARPQASWYKEQPQQWQQDGANGGVFLLDEQAVARMVHEALRSERSTSKQPPYNGVPSEWSRPPSLPIVESRVQCPPRGRPRPAYNTRVLQDIVLIVLCVMTVILLACAIFRANKPIPIVVYVVSPSHGDSMSSYTEGHGLVAHDVVHDVAHGE